MSPKDQFFTPVDIASELVNSAGKLNVGVVADFAAGRGDLLVAAKKRWLNATTLGIDVDRSLVATIRKVCDRAIGQDFMEIADVRAWMLRCVGKLADIVLLNPPFSVRGRGWVESGFRGVTYKSSIALAFVVRGLEGVRRGGELLAVVPHGVLTSERDRVLFGALSHFYHVSVIRDDLYNEFEGCEVRCAIVRVRKSPAPLLKEEAEIPPLKSEILVARGSVDHLRTRLHRTNRLEKPWAQVLHTSNLRKGEADGCVGWVELEDRRRHGPVVALPRVGRLSSEKIVLINDARVYQFTKCVIVVSCETRRVAKEVHDFIHSEWRGFSRIYGGTGAQYTTLAKVRGFLAAIPTTRVG